MNTSLMCSPRPGLTLPSLLPRVSWAGWCWDENSVGRLVENQRVTTLAKVTLTSTWDGQGFLRVNFRSSFAFCVHLHPSRQLLPVHPDVGSTTHPLTATSKQTQSLQLSFLAPLAPGSLQAEERKKPLHSGAATGISEGFAQGHGAFF